MAGEENLTVSVERRMALRCDVRGDRCGDVGFVGVAGRDELPVDVSALG